MNIRLVLTPVFVITLASGSPLSLLESLDQSTLGPLNFEMKIIRLFRNINQPDYYNDQNEIAVTYDIEDNIGNYNNSQAVREFWNLNRLGFLPKDEIFSIFNQRHRREAIALFKVLYYAKDKETFYKTACWARLFMNGGLFVYSASVALVQRLEMATIDLPPIYEIFPEYFFNSDVIREAQKATQSYSNQAKIATETQRRTQEDAVDFHGITIDAKYSHDSNHQRLLSYFTEDIGLSAYYYYYNLYYPFWLPNEMINSQSERRGEQFYHMIQQLLARYYLECRSNGLGEITILDFMIPINTAYYPSMSYQNGKKFPVRPNISLRMDRAMENTRFDNNYTNSYIFVRDYERRIRDAIDLGYITTSTGKQINLYDGHGFETLGNMIEGNTESPNVRFYGCLQIFVRLFLGNATPKLEQGEYVIAPSALEHFETSLRDPIFYRFCKRMLTYFQRYLSNVPPYTTKELLMAGVKIENVEITENFTTYFENFYADISNAVYNKDVAQNITRVPVRVRQMRLNHKPFRYVMNVNSDGVYNALVKVFLGPKYDELGRRLDITESRLNFVEIDIFSIALTSGINYIERDSSSGCYNRDRLSFRETYKRAVMGTNMPSNSEGCLLRRLRLPKGESTGQVYQMYYIIVPYQPTKDHNIQKPKDCLLDCSQVTNGHSMGYPLDRPIDENDFYVPNSFFKDVTITHEDFNADL